MTKYTFSFESDCFEDLDPFHKAYENAHKLESIDNYLRSQIKHCDHPEAVETALQNARDKLHEY